MKFKLASISISSNQGIL